MDLFWFERTVVDPTALVLYWHIWNPPELKVTAVDFFWGTQKSVKCKQTNEVQSLVQNFFRRIPIEQDGSCETTECSNLRLKFVKNFSFLRNWRKLFGTPFSTTYALIWKLKNSEISFWDNFTRSQNTHCHLLESYLQNKIAAISWYTKNSKQISDWIW